MIYTASHIANFFLERKEHNITSLKLNKLIYISFGFHAWASDSYLFHEDIQAWKYGTIIPSIYHEFKEYGFRRIDRLSYILSDYDHGTKKYPRIPEKDEDVREVLSKVWEIYGGLSDWRLVDITYRDGTPWSNHYKKDSFYNIIPKEEIKEYYRELLDICVVKQKYKNGIYKY